MKTTKRVTLRLMAACMLFTVGMSPQTQAAPPADAGFTQSTDSAMARMDHDMMTPPTGNVDRDFARMMIPHHQGAIDMALAEIRYGHDEVLLRLAHAIVAAQQQEIAVMQQALAALPPDGTAASSTAEKKD